VEAQDLRPLVAGNLRRLGNGPPVTFRPPDGNKDPAEQSLIHVCDYALSAPSARLRTRLQFFGKDQIEHPVSRPGYYAS
jgi:hypothetical protein